MIDPDLAADRLAKLDALGPRPPWWRFRARRRFDRSVRAIAAMDVSVSAGILRDIYNVEAVREAAERPNPMYAFLRKDAQIVGLDHVTPITYASPHALDHEGIEEAKRLITRAVNGRGKA